MKEPNPDLILVGDLHATDSQPICRTDDFRATQIRKGEWLKSLWQDLHYLPILQVGDVFESWKATPWTISMLLEHYPPMITIPGNHDLPNHRLEDYGKSALKVLEMVGPLEVWSMGWTILKDEGDTIYSANIDIMPWGVKEPIKPPEVHSPGPGIRNVLVAHVEITDGQDMMQWEKHIDFLRRFPQYDLIVTGHNHAQFILQDDHQILINPGSFTRQTASETHSPAVYLWWAVDNRLERVEAPHDPQAVTRTHLEEKVERDSKIAAFIEMVGQSDVGKAVVADFVKNVEAALADPEIGDKIKEKVRWALDPNTDKGAK